MFRLAAAMACLLVCSESVASRIPQPFDLAFESAELVLQGDVMELWNPFEKESRGGFGRNNCYRFKVGQCLKGELQPGAEIVFWDRHAGSTASYGIYTRGEYVVYLSPAELSDYETRILNPGGGAFYRPSRVRCNSGATADLFARELRLLDLFVLNPPADKRKAYRQLLASDSDSIFLSYVVKDWPRPCAQEDIELFKRSVLASDGNELYVRWMLAEMVEHPDALSDSDVAVLMQKAGADLFNSLRPLITERNIGDLRELLFAFLSDSGAGGSYRQFIETLSALDPDYFKTRLVETHDFPWWKLLPCLKALGLNGSDLGRPDFPEEVFSVSHNTLLAASKIREGDLFYVSFPLLYPEKCPDFKAALPLLEPLLREPDSPVRRACVALFRTYGVPVKRSGGIYIPHGAAASAPCPVKLELRMDRTRYTLGEEIELVLKETAIVDGGDFCFEGKPLVTLHLEGGWHSPELLDQKQWEDVALDPDHFVVLERGMSREHRLKLVRTINRPGTYRIEMKKCYLHDGGTVGADAWTGMVFAENELVFAVEEP